MDEPSSLPDRLRSAFQQHFHASPTFVARAPGRVNLIGEHTDYNDGFVLPMAIDRAVYFAARPRKDRLVRLIFLDFAGNASFQLDNLTRGPSGPVEYVKGVAAQLASRYGHLPGLDGVIAGSIPISAGLSSSAALELAAARMFCELAGIPWQPVEMAKLAQRAENEWVGMNCGIMDQLICAAGRRDTALLIDCRTLHTTPVPLPEDVTIVVMDTATRRSGSGLVDSAYGERRAQCEEAARILQVPALRDCTLQQLEAHRDQLDPVVYRRARHVVSENDRVLAAHDVMADGDAAAMGRLMNASHDSLQQDFDVSTPALDAMAAIARAHPACFGARMTGAGFGGCAVAAVQSSQTEAFTRAVSESYKQDMQLEPQLYACHAADGASLIQP